MARFKTTLAANRERAGQVFERLREAYPDARCSLDYKTPLQLLVATILAAQCTDARVNEVSKTLFKKYRKARDYAGAPREELEAAIRTCGFFRQKTGSIVNACAQLVQQHGGKVPGRLEDLVALDGVGRKTANVVLGECFDTPGIVVDTHVRRLARRLGFTRQDAPAKIEQDLMRIWPRETWTLFSHCLVFHGRTVCLARKPRCAGCPISDLCPFPTARKE